MAMKPSAWACAASALLSVSAGASGALTADRVLLVYNSANADSLAVRNAYVSARPGVLQFDLNDPTLPAGSIPRSVYLSKVRAPLLAFLNSGPAGNRMSERVIAMATTLGLPARVDGTNEFAINSTWASLESELAIIQQDLETGGRAQSLVVNPYYRRSGQMITNFARTGIETPRSFTLIDGAFWQGNGLTSGDIYMVTRLDSAAGGAGAPTATAVANVQSLIARSGSLLLAPCRTRALLDEWSCADQLDDDGGSFIPAFDDFTRAAALFAQLQVQTIHDQTSTFFTGTSLPPSTRQLIAVGTYGENHSLNGCGADPPGAGTYVQTFGNLAPGAVFIAYESFGGHSIAFPGQTRFDQGQALDFIAAGGCFTIATVAEPFTLMVADLEMIVTNMLISKLTFAEAAYSSMPGLSWQNTPVGDPLAKFTVLGGPGVDLTGDGLVNSADLATVLGAWGSNDCVADLNNDGMVNATDLGILLGSWS